MVGDGMTDLEAQPVVDAFIAFAGVVERPTVVGAAESSCERPRWRRSCLPLDGEPPRDLTAQSVFEKGMRMALRSSEGYAWPFFNTNLQRRKRESK